MGAVTKKQKLSKEKTQSTKTENDVSPSHEPVLSLEAEGASSEEIEEASDSDLDDEFDVDNVSSDDENAASSGSESEEDSDSESDDDKVPTKRKKKASDDGTGTFATAFNAILGSKLKAYDRKDPILARNKSHLKKLESDKLEAKAKRLILAEKKDLRDKQRIKNLLPNADEPEKVREALERERAMKKVAQKGVVRLFNAVLATQVKTNQEISKEKVGLSKKEELMTEISKNKFLDLVKAAGQT